ncbi:MAG: hypothetical protein Q8S11_17630 [Daejeonella sp.]|uniref:hypothetical protein n=1 Tax=Daejeonella sp. TaxID=2805397 RepID=UPI002736C035|nr:hypothetical protein [Daejeonella sp.]MDP3470167.1 hypothetical protein [Daejeonella sp.]
MIARITIILIFCISLISNTRAQENRAESSVPEKRAQNIFVELGGQGLLFTANYDTRFSNRRDGLGGRVGIGYVAIDGDNATTVPLSLNYLLGKGKHFFEMGLGATFMATGGTENSFFFDDNNSNVIGTMSFSYRLQPSNGGFSLRAGITPVFNKNFFIPYYAGLSLGYSF